MTSAQSSPEKTDGARTLPEGFVEAVVSAHAPLEVLRQSLLAPPDVSVRVNAAKGASVPAGAERVSWCPEGFYLTQREAFTFDPAMHQGLYYVQDASSMVMAHVARLLTRDGRAVRWLDACAAPGGKTTAAISALPAGSMVVANEFDARRAAALMENVERWGHAATMVTTGDTSALRRLPGFFDIVAVDAPCSGEGMMRKEEAAVKQWSPALVGQCAALQREILENVWQALRPGGYLVYSTCTFNTSENEENVAYIAESLGGEPVDLGLDALPGVIGAVCGNAPCARFLPGNVRGEGLFMAVLRKPGDEAATVVPQRIVKSVAEPRIKGMLGAGLLDGEFIYSALRDGSVVALPAAHAAAMTHVAATLRAAMPGLVVATPKGRDLLPTYALAHATALRREAWSCVDVDAQAAVATLRGEPLSSSACTALGDAPRGPVLLTYGGHPLAFANNLGNRANNLVPHNRRILSGHIPAEMPRVL